jgi:hypothetical protein
MSTTQATWRGAAVPGRFTEAVEPGEDAPIGETVRLFQQRYITNQICPAELDGRVRGFYCQFEPARIRRFVAVLVERFVRHSIEQPSTPTSGKAAV